MTIQPKNELVNFGVKLHSAMLVYISKWQQVHEGIYRFVIPWLVVFLGTKFPKEQSLVHKTATVRNSEQRSSSMSESALICAKTELASLSQNQNIFDSDSGFIGLTPVWPIHSSWLGLKVSSLLPLRQLN